MKARPALRVRPAIAAGNFYPADRNELRAAIGRSFSRARRPEPGLPSPKALIVPHAGFVYSGPVAASAYATLTDEDEDRVRRVILLGPSHHARIDGLAVSTADAFETPLGAIQLDGEARELIRSLPQCWVSDLPHAFEHSLEVQLPFLQHSLGRFTLVPLAVGEASADSVAGVLDVLWGGEETLVVVSTDLSHDLGYESATARDHRTSLRIVARSWQAIDDLDACGAHPLRGLLLAATRHDLRATVLDLRNCQDTSGTTDRVVGYGAFALRGHG